MLDGTVLSAKTYFCFFFLRKNGENNFALAQIFFFFFFTFQTSWRNESESAYLWTRKFNLNALCVDVEIFESGKKNLRIQKYPDTGGRDLREVSNLKRVDLLSLFFLQACSFDQLRSCSSQLYSEVDIVGVVVFCTPLSCFSNSRYASNRGYKVVLGHLFKSMLS